MNYWKIQAVARRKVRARNDIMGLLENNHRRKSKTKKTQPVVRKQFGIFAKALTINVRLNENNEYEPIGNGTPQSTDGRMVVRKPQDRANKNTIPKRNKAKTNGGKAVVRRRMQEFDVEDLIDDNEAANDADQRREQPTNEKNDRCQKAAAAKRTPHLNLVHGEAAQINRNIQNDQSEDDFSECGNCPVDFKHVSVDFTIGTLDVTAIGEHPLGKLDVQDLLKDEQTAIGSFDFNAFETNAGADDYKPFANIGNFQTEQSFCKSVSDASEQFQSWSSSLQTPRFDSDDFNSSLTTVSHVIANSPDFQPSASDERYGRHCFVTHANQHAENSTVTPNSFEPCDENSTFNDFDAPAKLTPFTLRMVVGRKSVGAHHARQRIFGNRVQ